MSYILTRPWFWILAALLIIGGAYVGHLAHARGSLPRNAQLRQDYASAGNFLNMARNNGTQAMYDNAIMAYTTTLGHWPAQEAPVKRAETLLTLADALLEAGRIKNDPDTFSQAYSTYIEAQKTFTRKDAPKQWALAEYGAAQAIEELAGRQNSQYYLNAVQLYKSGLETMLFPDRIPENQPANSAQ